MQVDDPEFLAGQFEANRGRLRAVAHRMLGSVSDADDAVQEAWIRLSRAPRDDVQNLSGWLTTVVARVCLDMLRSRKARKEHSLDEELPGKVARLEAGIDPEAEAVIADSVGLALLVVLEVLTPAERVAYVLHDMFDLPFDEVGPIVGRSEIAARKLASRARRRVQGAEVPEPVTLSRRREVVEAFMAASREGNFAGLIRLLDPDVVLISDDYSARRGSPKEVVGPDAVAKVFAGRAQGAQLAMVDGAPAMVWAPGGKPKGVFSFEIAGGRIDEIEVVSDPARLAGMKVELVDA
jgi:RNA polymerase sigma-70 factor (ECF subfamily)